MWWLLGAASFVYWWTSEYSFTSKELWVMCIVGLGGPIAFFVGSGIYGQGKVLLRKRS